MVFKQREFDLPIHDERLRLEDSEKESIETTLSEIFSEIEHEGDAIPEEPEFTSEIPLAKALHERKTIENERKRINGLLASIEKNSAHPSSKTNGGLRGYNPIGLQDELAAVEARAILSTSTDQLNEQKKRLLTRGLAGRLKGETGATLKRDIKRLVLGLELERKKQEQPLHTRDAYTIMVYELVYGDFLWRNKKRKNKRDSYFTAHLLAAAENQTKHGFTSITSLLCAIKHDDVEDLEIHRKDCWKVRKTSDGTEVKNKKTEFKEEWLFCDDLYKNKINDDSTSLDSGERLLKGKENVKRTVLSLTSPDEDTEDEKKNKKNTAKLPPDEEKAIKYLNELLINGYAAALKVIEQIQNAETIDNLDPDRRDEKMRLILILHGLMARVLEMKHAQYGIIGAGIDHYKPELRAWFEELQMDRMRERLIPLASRNENPALAGLLKRRARVEKTETLSSLLGSLLDAYASNKEQVESVCNQVRDQIQDIYKVKGSSVVSIEIKPTPLESYVDAHKLMDDPAYYPEVNPDDPMFEIVVCVRLSNNVVSGKDEDQRKALEDNAIWETAMRILKYLRPDQRSLIEPDRQSQEGPVRGMELEITNNQAGGKLKFRINSERNEALAKRGLRAQQRGEKLPEWLRERVKRTLAVAASRGESIFQVAEEVLMRRQITVLTDETKREPFSLNEGDTILDFAAALPGDKGMRALMYGRKAFLRDGNARREISIFDTAKNGDICLIEMEDVSTLTAPTTGIAEMVFANNDRTRRRFKHWYRDGIIGGGAGAKTRVQAAIKYLDELRILLNLTETDEDFLQTIYLEAAERSGTKRLDPAQRREKMLNQVGTLSLDPLSALSKYVDPKKRVFRIRMDLPQTIGILEGVTACVKQNGLNIRKVENNNVMDERTSLDMTLVVPEGKTPYELLKFILLLQVRWGGVTVLSNLFKFDKARPEELPAAELEE